MTPDNDTVKTAITTASEMMKTTDCLMPTFFIGGENGLGIVGAPFGSEKEKDAVASFIKMKAAEENADFVLFISESYTIKDQEAAKDFMENRDKYDSVSTHPKAVEVLMFALETKTRNWMGLADIKPNRDVGEVEWIESTKSGGRFANFLGEKPTVN